MKRILIILLLVLLASPSFAAIEVTQINGLNLAALDAEMGFPRNGTTADLTFSGTHSCAPTNVYYRIVDNGTTNPISGHNWTILGNATMNGSTFSGTASAVPQGGYYNVDVRCDLAGDEDDGTTPFVVGMSTCDGGQSNGYKWFTEGTDQTLDSGAIMIRLTAAGWSAPTTGNGAVSFTNAIHGAIGVPVIFVDGTVSGSALLEENAGVNWWWLDFVTSGKPYKKFHSLADNIGGCEVFLWTQGEADGYYGVTTADYTAGMNSLINQIRNVDAIPNQSQESNIPLFISQLGRTTDDCALCDPTTTDGFQSVRQSQLNITTIKADTYLAATTYDLGLRDTIHYTDAAYSTHGGRMAQSVLHMLGEVTYSRGPYISGFTMADATHADVTIVHRGGTDITPTSPTEITGFEAYVGGSWETPSSALRTGATTIQLTITGAATDLRYMYGKEPTITEPVYDNSTLALPLEWFPGIIQVSLFTDRFGNPIEFQDVNGRIFNLKIVE